VYTLTGVPFSTWVKERCDERNRELAEKHDLNITIDPAILEVIKNSTAISTQKGSSVGLLKIGSKRRRTRAELEELKEQERLKKEEDEAQQAELMMLRRQVQDQEDSALVLSQMIEAGVLSKSKHGNYELVKH